MGKGGAGAIAVIFPSQECSPDSCSLLHTYIYNKLCVCEFCTDGTSEEDGDNILLPF